MPEAVPPVPAMDIRPIPDTDPDATSAVVHCIEAARWSQQLTAPKICLHHHPGYVRWMLSLWCCSGLPRPVGKDLRWVGQWIRLTLHVVDEIVPDIIHCFHLIPALLHPGEATVPSKAYQTDAAFHAQARCLQAGTTLQHIGTGTDRIIQNNRWLIRVDAAFDQLA